MFNPLSKAHQRYRWQT